MRRLSVRGVGLLEVMVTVAIVALLALAALPPFAQYLANGRVREGANLLVMSSMSARSEALRRNQTVTLRVRDGVADVLTADGNEQAVLRSVALPPGVIIQNFEANYDSTGRLTPFGTELEVRVASNSSVCSEVRCPVVLMLSGGSTSLCNQESCP